MTARPSLYLSHGLPMTALLLKLTGKRLADLAARLPRPRAIVLASAHWLSRQPQVDAAALPKTIHDFASFPSAQYQLHQPKPCSPSLAAEVTQRLSDAYLHALIDLDRGLDHAAGVPLRRLYPNADIPVVPMTIQPALGPAHHYALGRALVSLRNERVLIIGSGSITHNLNNLGAD